MTDERTMTYSEQIAALVADGVLCTCGDTVGERNDPRIPPRSAGGRRGQCRCFRARRRQDPRRPAPAGGTAAQDLPRPVTPGAPHVPSLGALAPS